MEDSKTLSLSTAQALLNYHYLLSKHHIYSDKRGKYILVEGKKIYLTTLGS